MKIGKLKINEVNNVKGEKERKKVWEVIPIYEMEEGWEWGEKWPRELDTGTIRALKEESGWCNFVKTKIEV